jgi:hypothetical protein
MTEVLASIALAAQHRQYIHHAHSATRDSEVYCVVKRDILSKQWFTLSLSLLTLESTFDLLMIAENLKL